MIISPGSRPSFKDCHTPSCHKISVMINLIPMKIRYFTIGFIDLTLFDSRNNLFTVSPDTQAIYLRTGIIPNCLPKWWVGTGSRPVTLG